MTKFDTSLDALEPYINGHKFIDASKFPVRCDERVLEDFLTLLEEDNIAKTFFDTLEVPVDFYNTMVDFKHLVPKDMREEIFFAAKNGEYYKEVPSMCVYMIRKAWSKCYGIPNLIFKILPISAIKEFCKEGYLGSLTLRDVVCNVCTDEYTPLGTYNRKNKLRDFTEIYVQSTDMVAAVPHSIGDILDDASIAAIQQTSNGLAVGNKLLRTMGGRVGAINSVYDLREVI